MDRIRVLFVCRHNSGRSQIAEAFLNCFGQDRFEAHSAGTEPTSVDPLVMAVMAEEGLDIRAKTTTDLRALLRENDPFHYLVTTSGPEVLDGLPPLPPQTERLNWAFPDPEYVTGSQEEQLAAARAIRDDIRTQVIRFLNEMA
jgi:arsenate reductase